MALFVDLLRFLIKYEFCISLSMFLFVKIPPFRDRSNV